MNKLKNNKNTMQLGLIHVYLDQKLISSVLLIKISSAMFLHRNSVVILIFSKRG